MTTHVAVAPAFADLIDLWAPVRQIGTGFQFTEGPVWHPKEHFLLFSDMRATCGGAGIPPASARRCGRPTNATA